MIELLDASIRGLTPDQILRGEKSLDLAPKAHMSSESVRPSS
jgi:hypothetical protein